MDRTAMLPSKLKVVFLLNVLASSILAAGDEVYGKHGGEITLTPGPFSVPLTRIVWKHGDDKAIEWEGEQTDTYRQFKVSTTLDTKTGEMTIRELDSRFNGDYSADVNGIQATEKWTLTVLDPVSKPSIHKKCHKSTCELSCENEATVKVQCAWRKGEEELQKYNRTLVLEKTDDKVGKAYTCNCSNSVSFAVSDPVVPFDPDPNPLVGIIVGLLSGLFILGGVIAFIFREKLRESVQTCCGTRGNAAADNQGGSKDASQKNAAVNQDGANETSEDMPLKGNADHADEGGAKDTSQTEPIYENGAVNQDGANETSQGDTPNGPNA